MDWRKASLAVIALGSIAAASPDARPFEVQGNAATISWMRQFTSRNDDWVNELVQLRNGNVMAVGFLDRRDGDASSDWRALAAEFTAQGKLVADRRYGEGAGIDAFWSVAETADRQRIFAGFTTRFGGGGIDGLALTADAEGSVRSERAFGGAGYDRFTDIAATDDGFLFLGHSQAAGSDKRRIFIVKTGLDGRAAWERVHDAPDSWGALYIEPAGDGGFIIAGGTSVADDRDMFVMKVDAEGRQLWRKRVGTSEWNEINHGLVVRRDGSIVLAGYTHRRGEESNDVVAATLSPEGEVRRMERFGGQGDDRAILAKADDAGRIWIIGHTASAGAGGSELLLARLDRQGRFEPAAITIGGPQDDHGTALLPLSDGTLLLAGYSRGLGGGGQDAFVLRLTAPQWNQEHPAFRREVANR